MDDVITRMFDSTYCADVVALFPIFIVGFAFVLLAWLVAWVIALLCRKLAFA